MFLLDAILAPFEQGISPRLAAAAGLALLLSLAATAAFALARRRISNPLILVNGLALLASAGGMAVVAGPLGGPSGAAGGPTSTYPTPAARSDVLLASLLADPKAVDGDGVISADESDRLADQIMSAADVRGRGVVNAEELRHAVRLHLMTPNATLLNPDGAPQSRPYWLDPSYPKPGM